MAGEGLDHGLQRRLPDRVREAVRREIEAGRWRAHLPSERHLSELLRVSRPTLHVALVALERDRVISVGADRRWRIAARRRRARPVGRRAGRLVLLYRGHGTGVDLTSMLEFVDLLRAEIHRLGHDLHVLQPFARGARGVEATLAELDAEHRASLYILHSVPAAVHAWFERKGIPAVVVGSHDVDSRLPSIDLDPAGLVSHAIHHLTARGHRRIALFNLPAGTLGAARRNEVFLRSCAERTRDGVLGTVITSPSRPDAVEAAVRQVYRRRPFPTSVIVTQLEHLIGLYTTLGQLGLKIPQDVSVVSEYYVPVMQFLRPVPTAYDWPTRGFVTRIIRLVRNYSCLGAWSRTSWNLIPELLEGKSVASIRRQDS